MSSKSVKSENVMEDLTILREQILYNFSQMDIKLATISRDVKNIILALEDQGAEALAEPEEDVE